MRGSLHPRATEADRKEAMRNWRHASKTTSIEDAFVISTTNDVRHSPHDCWLSTYRGNGFLYFADPWAHMT